MFGICGLVGRKEIIAMARRMQSWGINCCIAPKTVKKAKIIWIIRAEDQICDGVSRDGLMGQMWVMT